MTPVATKTQSFVVAFIVAASLASCISARLLCEDLPIDLCAFSVSSTGSRCILEKDVPSPGKVEYHCQASDVNANDFAEWVETDYCVHSCGLDRLTVGISSDSLMEKRFVKSLCSSDCQDGCPNVVDIFGKLSEEEGVSLSRVCEAQSVGAARQRQMSEIEISHFASLSSETLNAWEFVSAALSPAGSIVSGGLSVMSGESPAAAPSSL